MTDILDTPMGKEEKEVDTVKLEGLISDLANKLTSMDQDFPKLLRMIHRNLADRPDLTFMLSPEQVNTIVQGYQRYTKIEIVKEGARGKKGAKIGDVSLDDL